MEVQKEVQCNQFREMLKEKEDELLILSQEREELGGSESGEKSPPTKEKEKKSSSFPDDGEKSKIEALENKLREERQSHENEVLALQV